MRLSTQVIVIANQKGGPGKTTICAHLAYEATKKGKVCIIDVDPQKSLLGWFKDRPTSDITCYAVEYTEILEAVEEIQTLGEYDYLFVDTAGSHTLTISSLLLKASLVIIPCQASKLDVKAARTTAHMLDDHKIPFCFVLNRIRPQDKRDAEGAETTLSHLGKVLTSRVAYRNVYMHSMGLGIVAAEREPSSPAVLEIKSLWSEIETYLNRLVKHG